MKIMFHWGKIHDGIRVVVHFSPLFIRGECRAQIKALAWHFVNSNVLCWKQWSPVAWKMTLIYPPSITAWASSSWFCPLFHAFIVSFPDLVFTCSGVYSDNQYLINHYSITGLIHGLDGNRSTELTLKFQPPVQWRPYIVCTHWQLTEP